MLVGVRGALEAVGSDWVNVQVGGVTLQVSVPASSVANLGSVGEPVRLHTILRIQNEQPVLYGFTEAGSVELFGALTGVSGIGPRSAMAILSELGEDGFRQAVASEDVAALARAQGVGRTHCPEGSSGAARQTAGCGRRVARFGRRRRY